MADWDPTTYEPEREEHDERWNADRQARAMGVSREVVNAWLRANWIDFEKKLDEHGKKRWAEAGLTVTDAEKATHRRKFHDLLRREFGRSLPDRDWTEKVEEEIAKRSSGRPS